MENKNVTKKILILLFASVILFGIGWVFNYSKYIDKVVQENRIINITKSLDLSKENYYKGVKFQTKISNRWYTVYDDLEYKQSLFTDDYFFVGSSYDYKTDSSAQLSVLNLKTGKKYVVYGPKYHYIRSIQRIGNTVFFSFGPYLGSGEMYFIDLSSNPNRFQQIKNASDGHIEEIEGNLWIVDSFGDACISTTSYQLFDLVKKEAIPVAYSADNCGSGNELEIFEDRIINLFHNGDVNNYGSKIYSKASLIDLKDPRKEIELISNEQMPPSVHEIILDRQNNLLLLEGSREYIFGIDSKKFMDKGSSIPKKDIIPPDLYNNQRVIGFSIYNSGSGVDYLGGLKLPPEYRLDFTASEKK